MGIIHPVSCIQLPLSISYIACKRSHPMESDSTYLRIVGELLSMLGTLSSRMGIPYLVICIQMWVMIRVWDTRSESISLIA
jgi:hypothetical protein